jgi:hypothetical protein
VLGERQSERWNTSVFRSTDDQHPRLLFAKMPSYLNKNHNVMLQKPLQMGISRLFSSLAMK